MKAVQFTKPQQIDVVEKAIPDPESHQVLVRQNLSLISPGTELRCLKGDFAQGTHWDQWVQYPFAPGYSTAGVVEAVGNQVEHIKTGQRVAGTGPHAEYHLAKPNALWLIPNDVTDEQAIFTTLSNVAQHGFRKAALQLGESVAVVGLGILGQLMVQYCQLSGAQSIVAIDPIEWRHAFAQDTNTHHVVGTAADAKDDVMRLTHNKGVQVAFDMTGHPDAFASSLELLRRFGRLILVGDTGTPTDQRLTGDVLSRDLQVIGAHGSNPPGSETDQTPWTRNNMAELFLDFVAQKRMCPEKLITHRLPIMQAAEAYGKIASTNEQTMGVALTYGQA